MSDSVQLDLATLALKGRRYSEAESLYTQIAVANNSPEAWVGIGICKLYQLTDGRTMDEVIYCFNKAKSIDSSLNLDIDNQLIYHCNLLVNVYFQAFLDVKSRIKKHQKDIRTGVIIAGVSAIAGMNSKSSFGTIASLAGTSAGVGVAVDAFSKMSSMQEIRNLFLQKCDEVNNAIRSNIDNNSQIYLEFESNINKLISEAAPWAPNSTTNRFSPEQNRKAGIALVFYSLGFYFVFNSLYIWAFVSFVVGIIFNVGAKKAFVKHRAAKQTEMNTDVADINNVKSIN